MSVIEGVLEEEIERLIYHIDGYKKMLLSLPSGSLFVRKMGNSSFAYLKRRENGKVVSVYLGNVEDENVQKQIALNKDYKMIRNSIRVASDELSTLRKAFKAYERRRKRKASKGNNSDI